MDPFSLALAAGGLVSSFAQGGRANDIAQENLDFQRKQAGDQLRFAKGGRTDAYGNQTTFDDALNRWITTLTPEQQRLVKAGEHEQLLGLTEDASRNRNVRERAFARGQGAEQDFNSAVAGYRYDQPHSEDAIMNEISNLITQSRGTGDRAEAALASRQGIRQAGNLPAVYTNYTGGTGGGAGVRLAENMLKAREAARTEHSSRVQDHNSRYLPAIQQFNSLAGGGGDAKFSFSDTPANIDSQTQNLSKLVSDAYKTGGSEVNSAAGTGVKAANVGPGMGDFTKLIAALKPDKAKTGDPGFFGGNPGSNTLLSPSTYGNRNWTQDDYGDFTF